MTSKPDQNKPESDQFNPGQSNPGQFDPDQSDPGQSDPLGGPTQNLPETPSAEPVEEIGGPKGPEPTRFGDWERAGRCSDF